MVDAFAAAAVDGSKPQSAKSEGQIDRVAFVWAQFGPYHWRDCALCGKSLR